MNLLSITPYVRFARVHGKPLTRIPVTALDHRIFYCHDGTGEITAGGKAYPMKPGAFLFIRGGIPYKNTSPCPGMILFAFNFDFCCRAETMGDPITFVKASNFRPEMLLESELPTESDVFSDVLYIPEFYKKGTLQEIIDEYSRKPPYYTDRCSTLLKDVLISAARTKKEALIFADKNKASAIKAYVKEHFNEPITNESVSRHFSYHKNYMNRIFKNETGQTLHQFLLSYRIQIAVSLLLSGEYTVTDVAGQVGFSETSHFSACFKKITGHTPSFYIPKTARISPADEE